MAIEAGDVVWKIRGDDSDLKKSLKTASDSVKKFGPKLTAVGAAITGSFAAIGIGALKIASDVDTASKRIAVSLGLPITAAGDFRKVIKEVYGDQFGETMEDVGASVQDVAQQLDGLGITAKSGLKEATESALALRDTFQLEVGESTQAVRALMTDLGLTATEAFDFVTAGMTRGLNASDDFLDSITEYANQFAEGGATAGEFFSLLESGLKSGVLGTDKAADLFKEFQVRILDGSKATSEALLQIGINSEQFLAGLASGQTSVVDAFTVVQERLRGVNDQSVLMQAGVGLLGTQFEDLGPTAALALDLTGTKMADLSGATDKLNAQYDTFGNALEGIRRKGVLALEDIGASMLPVIQEHMPQILAAFEKLTALGPTFAKLFSTGLDFLLTKIVPVVEWSIKLATVSPTLTGLLAGTTAVLGALALVLGSVATIGFPIINMFQGLAAMSTIASGTAALGGTGVLGLSAALGPIGLGLALAGSIVIFGKWIAAVKGAKEAAEGQQEAQEGLDAATKRLIKQFQDEGVAITEADVALVDFNDRNALYIERINEAEDAQDREIFSLNGVRAALVDADQATASQARHLDTLVPSVDAATAAYRRLAAAAQQAQNIAVGGVSVPFTPAPQQGAGIQGGFAGGGGGGGVNFGAVNINVAGGTDASGIAEQVQQGLTRAALSDLRSVGMVL